ncbi:hypothetical protein EW146_g3142 [Bondarzewia mesenterica]|uniref:Rho-GAP domain-containing protein n=1 Tax=Bondarzewia mesenterica TaxID=1095465 RepID=A0A4S4LYK8_9AGAM|nr:hypothetical protein EW146_g3142 [Bondarzewia mesenterica]
MPYRVRFSDSNIVFDDKQACQSFPAGGHKRRHSTPKRSILKSSSGSLTLSEPPPLACWALPPPPSGARLIPRLDPHFLLWRMSMLKVMSNYMKDKPVKRYLDVTDFEEICVDDAMYRKEWRREHRRMARMRQGLEPSIFGHYLDGRGIWCVPLRTSCVYAASQVMLGGYEFDVPIVVAGCLMEFLRRGVKQRGLFKVIGKTDDLPRRVEELFEIYNSAPNFGEAHSLEHESTDHLSELLNFYLKHLPDPIDMHIFYALCDWCVAPSIEHDEIWINKEHDRVNEMFATGRIHPKNRPSTEAILHRRRGYPIYDRAREGMQIMIAQSLLRLMPTPNFNFLIFFISFLAEVGHTRGNGWAFDDLGRRFGCLLFGKNLRYAPNVLWWLLSRWDDISVGLFGKEQELCEGDRWLMETLKMKLPDSLHKWKWSRKTM